MADVNTMTKGMPPTLPQQAKGMPPTMPPKVKANMSVFNPADMAAMKQSGQFRPDMKVREVIDNFLALNNIDPEGPASQLIELGQKQVQNADPAGKMMNLAGGEETTEPTEMPAPAPGLEGLLKE